MACPYEKLHATLDRLHEAHLHLHSMEAWYHHADRFRWMLNCFLRALREVPDIIRKGELKNDSGFKEFWSTKWNSLISDPLFPVLKNHRDFVVHESMLKPQSTATVGNFRAGTRKLTMSWKLDPLEDSDDGVRRLAYGCKKQGDPLGFLDDEENADSVLCVERVWKLPEFDDEILDVCARAWLRVGEAVDDAIEYLGAEPLRLPLNCRHSADKVRIRQYSRKELNEWLSTLISEEEFEEARKRLVDDLKAKGSLGSASGC